MSKRMSSAVVSFLMISSWIGVGGAAELKDNWGDFLHYTKIGRFDLAKAYAQVILDSSPDPVSLFNLTLDDPQNYQILLMVHEGKSDPDLVAVTDKVLAVIEQGRQARRSDAKVILEEIERLASSTERGRMIALRRLQDSGEYAVPLLVDALADPARRDQLDKIVLALPQIGGPALRPLAAALQANSAAVRVEVVRALGKIGSPEGLPYLKYVVEYEKTDEVRQVAALGIRQIDPDAMTQSAAALFFKLAETYYNHTDSAGSATTGVTNMWFWDADQQRLVRKPVDSRYFHELMAMRCCEWALRADGSFGLAIGLWLASFYKAEALGVAMPDYFGDRHANAFVYATTAGPEYQHQALARAIRDDNADVARGVIEALIVTAGEKSIFSPIGSIQPLLQALTFRDRAVRTIAAIAVATASPRGQFTEGQLVMENLGAAVAISLEPNAPADANSGNYALRSAQAMLRLAQQRNSAFDLSIAQEALVKAARSGGTELKVLAGRVLAYLGTSAAQQAIAEMALKADNGSDVRIAAFESLAVSAKINGGLLADQTIIAIYGLIRSGETETRLRTAAATAFGALNLPSQKVKDLILDQARN